MSRLRISDADTGIAISGKRQLYKWVERVVLSEGMKLDQIEIIYCTDEYLLDLNKRFLNHDYFTDIITFDYSEGNNISGELYISYDRVRENASKFSISDFEEFRRVLIHGVLHLCGYKDKTSSDKLKMRQKEDEKLLMFGN